MNPSIYPNVIPANTFDKIMERDFMPASGEVIEYLATGQLGGGKVRTCGRRPHCIGVNCNKEKNANKPCCKNLKSYMDCIAEVRKQNIDSRRPENAGLPADAPTKEEVSAVQNPEPDNSGAGSGSGEKTGMPSWVKPVAIGAGVLLLAGGAYFMLKGKKGGASGAGQMRTAPIKAGR